MWLRHDSEAPTCDLRQQLRRYHCRMLEAIARKRARLLQNGKRIDQFGLRDAVEGSGASRIVRRAHLPCGGGEFRQRMLVQVQLESTSRSPGTVLDSGQRCITHDVQGLRNDT